MQNPAYISYKSVGASVLIDENPILKDTVLVYDNKKVAYLNYLSFQTGPDGFEDKSWETELKNVFSRFKAENADELILDLRFNGGGYLSTANVLASMIVPEKNLDKAFCKLKYNDDQKYKNSTVYFNSNLLDYNLGIGRVYILTSEFTASASEAVLNGLKA